MSDNHRETYRALVRALRAEFTESALRALGVDMREHRESGLTIGTLAQAVRDAADWRYDAGDRVTIADLEAYARDPLTLVRAGLCPDCGDNLSPEQDERRGCRTCGGWFSIRRDLPADLATSLEQSHSTPAEGQGDPATTAGVTLPESLASWYKGRGGPAPVGPACVCSGSIKPGYCPRHGVVI